MRTCPGQCAENPNLPGYLAAGHQASSRNRETGNAVLSRCRQIPSTCARGGDKHWGSTSALPSRSELPETTYPQCRNDNDRPDQECPLRGKRTAIPFSRVMTSHVHATLERCNASRGTPDIPCASVIRVAGPRVLVWNLGPGALGKSVPEIESWSLGLKVYRLLT